MSAERPSDLAGLAAAIGATLADGDGTAPVAGLATLAGAGPRQVSFFTQSAYRTQLGHTRAAAVILKPADAVLCPVAKLLCADPQLAYARAARLFAPPPQFEPGVHPSAWVSPEARLGPGVSVGPQSVIEAGAVLGERVRVGPNCNIGAGASIGADGWLAGNVTVAYGVRIGARARVQAGAVIGSDGFGLAFVDQHWENIPQLGSVWVGDDVDIGANTTVDRGALEDTVLEDGVKLDNQIQIAHNVRIGAHTAIAGCVGIAGSTSVGRYCMIGGGVGISGHLQIADRVQITGMSLVARSIKDPGVYSSGLTVEGNRLWNRISARLRQIERLAQRLTRLEARLDSRGGPASRIE